MDVNAQCYMLVWLLDACIVSFVQANGEARGKALRPPANVGIGVAVVL